MTYQRNYRSNSYDLDVGFADSCYNRPRRSSWSSASGEPSFLSSRLLTFLMLVLLIGCGYYHFETAKLMSTEPENPTPWNEKMAQLQAAIDELRVQKQAAAILGTLEGEQKEMSLQAQISNKERLLEWEREVFVRTLWKDQQKTPEKEPDDAVKRLRAAHY